MSEAMSLTQQTVACLDRWLAKIEACEIPTKRSAMWSLVKGQLDNSVKDGLISQEIADTYRHRLSALFTS